jgi:hypothetical protein
MNVSFSQNALAQQITENPLSEQPMTAPTNPQNDFERAAQQARDKVAAERLKKEEEARKKAEAAAERARQDEAEAKARRQQYTDLVGRFHQEFVGPLLRSFAQAQRVPSDGPSTESPKPGAAPAHKTVVMLLPANQPKLTVTISCRLLEPAGITGAFRSKDSVAVQVLAVLEIPVWKRVLGMDHVFNQTTHFVVGDFAGNQRLTVETWVRQKVTELSAKTAEVLARQGS